MEGRGLLGLLLFVVRARSQQRHHQVISPPLRANDPKPPTNRPHTLLEMALVGAGARGAMVLRMSAARATVTCRSRSSFPPSGSDSSRPLLPPQLKDVQTLDPGADGMPVVVQGWVRHRRAQKSVGFLSLNDGSSLRHTQVVVSPELARSCAVGSCVKVEGQSRGRRGSFCPAFQYPPSALILLPPPHHEGLLTKSPGAGQSLEIQAKNLQVCADGSGLSKSDKC